MSLVAVGTRSGGGASVEGGVLDEDEVVVTLADMGARFAALTGLRIHRLTCRFRLDATPKRRPQVSHTNAAKDS